MKTKLKTILPFILLNSLAFSQTIQMEFPHFAGRTYELILFQGDAQVKAIQDTIPANGKFTLKIPKEYAPYTGMSRWLLTNSAEGGGLDMPIPGKDFSVSCLVAKPSGEKDFVYKNNDDATLLNKLFREQQTIVSRSASLDAVLSTYDRSDKSYPLFQQEYAKQQKAYACFQQDLSKNNAYSARVFNIFGFTSGVGTELQKTEEARARNISDHIANSLDLNVLYTSGHWTDIISSWVDIHTQVLKDKKAFAADFAKIEKKTNPKLFTDFAGKVAYFLTKKGADDYIAALSPTVNQSSKILAFEGSMNAYKKALIGSQAPDIIIKEHIGDPNFHNHKTTILKSTELAGNGLNKTLVIFYESGCGPCENLLQQLPGNYEALKKKGIRVITISADTDEQVYRSKANAFPWKDSFCDHEGKSGINFQNYGAVGTPTIFLIDRSGKIEAKMAGLDEVLDKLK